MANKLEIDQRMFVCARQLVMSKWHFVGCSNFGAMAFVRKDSYGSIEDRMQVILAWDGTYNVTALGDGCDGKWVDLPDDGEVFSRMMQERFASTKARHKDMPEEENADA